MDKKLLDILYPEKCVVCHRLLRGTDGEKMCGECRKSVRPVTEPRCIRCSKPVMDMEEEWCEDCRGRTFYVEEGYALYPYAQPMRRAIRYLKYDGETAGAPYFADQMVERYGGWVQRLSPDVIIPVPIHKKKMRFRGFNQAACLAERIGERLEIPVDPDCIIRTQNTKPQKGLDSKARFCNLRKGFAVREGPGPYRTILLVDDIYTTGATLEACGKVLKEEGAKRIYFLCLCIGGG